MINGNCVKYLKEAYFMPFLILALLWTILVFTIMIDYDHGKTFLVPSLIFGYSILEWFLIFVEIGVFIYFNFEANLFITIAGGIILNLSLNIAFMLSYFIILKKSASIQSYSMEYKKTNLTIMILSFFISSRLFKLLYSRIGGKERFSINREFLKESKISKVYLTIHYFSLIPTILMFANAIYNLSLSS